MNNAKASTLTEGALTPKIIKYIIPLMLSGLLQLAYNAADSIIVGRWDGNEALAAVSSVGSLINLLINLFMGLSTGAAVAVAHDYGAKDYEGVKKNVHTTILLSVICGVIVGFFGFFFSKHFLLLMDSPQDVLPLSTLYLQIYFLGAPGNLLYNFGAAILRSVGDTKRPLYFLAISGLANVIFNLFFVIVLEIGVVGVALATIISQYMSAVMVVICLMKQKDCTNLKLKELRLHWEKLKKILIVGLPSGVQSSIFAISNVVIQSSINSFGSAAMAGNGAAASIEGFTYNAMASVYHASLTFVGQNVGAKRYERISAVVFRCVIIVVVIGIIFGATSYVFREPLLSFYITEGQEALDFGSTRMKYVAMTYFICGIMDVISAAQKGMGMSLIPMVTSLSGSCLLRLIWVATVFKIHHTPGMLFIVYPISWLITAGVHFIFYVLKLKQLQKKQYINQVKTA
ncbi:MAG: MATE family efflux transporter [Ruminococcaceae bacterium]|nr:MATE family efflux transporter [Oscillospiraceae bacterium]